jgi:adenosylcobinamide-GDP ribazoletransferase
VTGWSGPRLALGLLTIVPVGSPRTDRVSARAAVLWMPAVGLALGLAVAAALYGLRVLIGPAPIFQGVLAVTLLAVATRATHLDGLAGTVDGLGNARPAGPALEVMRRSDSGPFGVVALVLTLLLQAAALGHVVAEHRISSALVTAVVAGRLTLVWACRRGVPAARPDGLEALVADTVPTPAAVVLSALVLAGAATAGWLDESGGWRGAVFAAGAVVAALAVAGLLLRRCVRRFGGVTGHVLGACVELGQTAALLIAAAA